jgi:hypothetical protein
VLKEALELRLVADRPGDHRLSVLAGRVIPSKTIPILSLSSPSTTSRYSRVGMNPAWRGRPAVHPPRGMITRVIAIGQEIEAPSLARAVAPIPCSRRAWSDGPASSARALTS